jgi:putative methyltransferase (TIGR04325 family)
MNIRDVPILKTALEMRYRQRFYSSRGLGSWYGDYSSFAEASAAAPSGAPVGYDNTGTAELYDNFFRVDAKDYPVLFWLEKILRPQTRIFDFGGHVGHTCLAYRELLTNGPTLEWEVYDVPAIVAEGTRRVAANALARLSFTTDFGRASGADVLHAAGALQYEPRSLATMVGALPQPPKYIVINMTPTVANGPMVTLQNIGPAYCPYRIDDRNDIPNGLRALGYEQLATWENPEGRTRVPFSRRGRQITWVGHCFRSSS